MAYITKDIEDDEEQQGAPPQQGTVRPGAAPSASQGAPQQGSAGASQQTPQQRQGTGFTNLSSWLNAGKGRDKSITAAGNKAIGAEKDTFNAAVKPIEGVGGPMIPGGPGGATEGPKFTTLTNTPGVGTPVEQRSATADNPWTDQEWDNYWTSVYGDKYTPTGGRANTATVQQSADANPANSVKGYVDRAAASGNTDELAGLLTQEYKGPREVNYDPNASKNLWDADALSSNDTAVNVLGREEADKGQYSAGAQALDRVLFGADGASQKAMADVKTSKDAFGKDVKDRTGKALEKVKGFDDAAKASNAANKAALGQYNDQMMAQVNQRVAAQQAKDEEMRKALSDPTKYVDANGEIRTLAPGEVRGAVQGGDANVGNMVDDQEMGGFNALSKVLNLPTVQRNGTHANVTTGANTKDPNYGKLPSRGSHEPRLGSAMTMMFGKTPDLQHPGPALDFYNMYMALGPNPSAASVSAAYDDFQRKHPDIKIPTGEENDAWEADPSNAMVDSNTWNRQATASGAGAKNMAQSGTYNPDAATEYYAERGRDDGKAMEDLFKMFSGGK